MPHGSNTPIEIYKTLHCGKLYGNSFNCSGVVATKADVMISINLNTIKWYPITYMLFEPIHDRKSESRLFFMIQFFSLIQKRSPNNVIG